MNTDVPWNKIDTLWMIMATALVLFMTPALAFFYGGLVRTKDTLNTMMMSFISLGVLGVLWAFLGFTLSFSNGNVVIGDFSQAFLRGVDFSLQGSIPKLLFMAYQGTFAVITAALISGAIIGRMRFSAYMIFISLWMLLIYSPVAHWVWGGGWLAQLGAIDFAGGTVVHVNAAAAAFVASWILGPRGNYGRRAMLPHNVPFTLLGAGLLWFGWFGFNAGSALALNNSAILAFTTTFLAPMATILIWALLDLRNSGRVTAVGTATALVVGLVAITPAAGYVSPMSSLIIGALAALPSYYALIYRAKTRLDDSLDVIGAHGVGGTVGALLTGVFAQKLWNGTNDGLLFGHFGQLGLQAIAVFVVLLYSAVGTWLLLKLTSLFVPLRVEAGDEAFGLDLSQHGEQAYADGDGAVLVPQKVETGGHL